MPSYWENGICINYPYIRVMRKLFSALSLFFICFTVQAQGEAATLHKRAIVADTHNDFPSEAVEKGLSIGQNLEGITHSDLNRFKKGGVDLQVFSIFCGGNQKDPFQFALQEIDSVETWARRHPESIIMVSNEADLRKALKQNKLMAMLGVEGGHMIENDLAKLDSLANRGMAYLTLTWNNSLDWAASAADETAGNQDGGLSEFGKDVVRRLNTRGIMPDMSHVGEKTFWDVIEISTRPVIASHSNAYTLCPHPRNLKDDQIRAIAKSGGVVFINFYPGFLDSTFEKKVENFMAQRKGEIAALQQAENLTEDRAYRRVFNQLKPEMARFSPPADIVFDHIDYIVRLVGIEHVGLGADMDGVNFLPAGINSVADYPLITEGLIKRGYSRKEISKILGGNFLRVYRESRKGAR